VSHGGDKEMKSNFKSTIIKYFSFIFLILLFSKFSIAQRENSLQLKRQNWLEDLNYVTKTLIDHHPNVYYRISKDHFELTVEKAKQKIKRSRTDEECLTAIRQVVASIYDGHTILGVNNLPGYQDIFPVRMYEFSDGIYVTGIADEFAKCVGAKVIKIGRLSAEEAFARAGTLAFGDNEFYKKEQAPLVVITGKFAYGLGITEVVDRYPLLIESDNGKRKEIILSPVTSSGASNMLRGMDIGPGGISFASAFTGTEKERPFYLKQLDGKHNYWFMHDKEHRAIFMQFNLVLDQQDESFAEFYKRMFAYIDENANSIDEFILDLRFNNGGNGSIVLPFLNEIIKRDNINQPGHFYTIIGRRSFSAAVLLVAEMMVHTQTLLIGEPTGAAQNMFSDMVNRGTLPNCGTSLIVSSEIFNISWPGGKNWIISPHFPVPFSSSDFFSGNDPALDAIFGNKVKALETVLYEEGPKAALDYFNEINFDWGLLTNELSITPCTFPITKYKFGENDVNTMGYDFLNQNMLEEARDTFELNTKLFPHSFNVWDSYAEYFMKSGDRATATKYYRKSLELNPDNRNAANMIEQIGKQ
jgi:tetratricopeptide (TPR) repeat protein